MISGTIGIVYSHELMHQKNRVERWLGDLLLAMVLYSHFRSEHLLVHHRHVGTPRDPVTARYNEGFHRYFVRVLRDSPHRPGAPKGETGAQGGSAIDRSNPFWRYWALQGAAWCWPLRLGAGRASGFSCFRRSSRSGSWN